MHLWNFVYCVLSKEKDFITLHTYYTASNYRQQCSVRRITVLKTMHRFCFGRILVPIALAIGGDQIITAKSLLKSRKISKLKWELFHSVLCRALVFLHWNSLLPHSPCAGSASDPEKQTELVLPLEPCYSVELSCWIDTGCSVVAFVDPYWLLNVSIASCEHVCLHLEVLSVEGVRGEVQSHQH